MNGHTVFQLRRWIYLIITGVMLLATMGFTPYPTIQATCGSTVTVQSGDTLSSIAANCGVSLSDLEAANPSVTDPNTITLGEQINIPNNGIPTTGGSTSTYTVQTGDTLSSIAAAAGTTLGALESVNPQISDPNVIVVGQVINLPSGSTIPSTGGTSGSTYTVVAGDTMSSIAASGGITLGALEAANPQITDPNFITVGEVINLPSGTTIPTTGGTGGNSYTVVAGDTMSSIALSHNVTLGALELANPSITNPDLIFPGEQVVIP
jgi:LysM repeat protein